MIQKRIHKQKQHKHTQHATDLAKNETATEWTGGGDVGLDTGLAELPFLEGT